MLSDDNTSNKKDPLIHLLESFTFENQAIVYLLNQEAEMIRNVVGDEIDIPDHVSPHDFIRFCTSINRMIKSLSECEKLLLHKMEWILQKKADESKGLNYYGD